MVLTEYPITLDDSTANVTYIQEKLSAEAFNGEQVKLMNARNIAIADTEATRGMYSLHGYDLHLTSFVAAYMGNSKEVPFKYKLVNCCSWIYSYGSFRLHTRVG